jgi:Outer membrane protein beta-barrel domain
MKRVLWLIPAILFLGITAQAQDIPAWELSGGYSYLRADLNGASFALNGGNGTVVQNVNSWFGGRLDVNAYRGTTSGNTVSAQTITYGPVFAYRRSEKLTPFAQFQLGVMHATTGYLGISAPAYKFALVSGGGVDFNINERVAIRVQGDYLMTTFLALRQDNVRVSAGLVFRFGQK